MKKYLLKPSRYFLANVLRWNYPPSLKELLGFTYFFLIITSYYIIKPLRASKFLNEIGAEYTPYFYLFNSVLIFLIILAYNVVVDVFRGRKRALLLSVNGFLVLNILMFAFLFHNLEQRGYTTGSNFFSAVKDLAAGYRENPLVFIKSVIFFFLFERSGVTVLFFCWASFFAVFVVSVYWSLMSELFSREEGHRSYGFIGLGGVLGGALGGKITETLVTRVGENWLLVISAVILGICMIIIQLLMKYRIAGSGENNPELKYRYDAGSGSSKRRNGFSLIISDRYARIIALTVLFMTLNGTFFDFQLRNLCQMHIFEKIPLFELMQELTAEAGGEITDRENANDWCRKTSPKLKADLRVKINLVKHKSIPERSQIFSILESGFFRTWKEFQSKLLDQNRISTVKETEFSRILQVHLSRTTTRFFGWLYSTLSIVSFIVQIFLTARLHQTIGIPASLLILPLIAFIDVVLVIFLPLLSIFSAATIIQNALSYSLMQSTREQLYIPAGDDLRYKAKAFIDTFVFRAGDASASLLIIIAVNTLGLTLKGIAVFNIFIAAIWIYTVFLCGKEYQRRINHQQ